MNLTADEMARFWSHVVRGPHETDCWLLARGAIGDALDAGITAAAAQRLGSIRATVEDPAQINGPQRGPGSRGVVARACGGLIRSPTGPGTPPRLKPDRPLVEERPDLREGLGQHLRQVPKREVLRDHRYVHRAREDLLRRAVGMAAGIGPTAWTSGAAVARGCTTSTTPSPREEMTPLETTLSAPPQRVLLRTLLILGAAVLGFAASIILGLWVLILALVILIACSQRPVRGHIGDLWFAALGFALGPVTYAVLGLVLTVFDASSTGSGRS